MDYEEFLDTWARKYPREFGHPSRVTVSNKERLARLVKKYNGVDSCYLGLVHYPDVTKERPVIDRIMFDFDSKNDLQLAYSEAKNLASKISNSYITFSGRKGFHVYIFFDSVELDNPEYTVEKYCEMVADEYITVDKKIFSDVGGRRLDRVPGTQHVESGKYCIVVDPEWSLKTVKNKAQGPHHSSLPSSLKLNNNVRKKLKIIDKASPYAEREKKDIEVEVVEDVNYIELECVKKLRSTKLPSGDRRMKASKVLAVAFYLAHGSMEGFRNLAKSFAEYQDKDHQLKVAEVLGWKKGLYELEQPIEWNCGEILKYFKENKVDFECPPGCVYKEKKEQIKERRKKKGYMKTLKSIPLDYGKKSLRKMSEQVVGQKKEKLLLYYLLLGRQSIFVRGESSTGKNTMVDAVLSLFPDDMCMTISTQTEKIMRWLSKDRIPIVYIKEVPPGMLKQGEGDSGFTFDLKLLMSDHVLRIWYVDASVKPPKTRKRDVKVDSVVQTTTAIDLPGEYENRGWIISSSSSPNLTDKVLNWKAGKRMDLYRDKNENKISPKMFERVSEAIMNLGNETLTVNPLAKEIKGIFTTEEPRARRDIDKVLDLVEIITRVHYKDRLAERKDGKEVLISSPTDVHKALKLAKEALVETLLGIDRRGVRAYNKLSKIVEESDSGTVTSRELADEMTMTQDEAREILGLLTNEGILAELDSRRGHFKQYTKSSKLMSYESLTLPSVEELKKSYREWVKDHKSDLNSLPG